MKLVNLQQEFANYVYDKKQTKIFDQIKSYGVSKERRLQVYYNNVIGNFDDVLAEIYKTVKGIVGEDYFKFLAKKYHQKYRSKSGNMDDYGAYFSGLLSSLKKSHKLLYLKLH